MDSSDTPRTDGISASQETESSQVQQSRSRAKTDPAWVHGLELEALVDGKKKWIRCMYCNELFKGGGIHRLKMHLAGIKGDVKGCPKVSAEVRYEMEQSVELFAGKKRKADEETARVRVDAGDDCVEVSPQEVAANTRASRSKKGKAAATSSKSTTNRPADRFFFYLEGNQVINKQLRACCNLKNNLKGSI